MISILDIRPAQKTDAALLVQFIRDLAAHVELSHECFADEDKLREALFGSRPGAEALLGFVDGEPVAFAIFFQNFSTFLTQPGLYLEDLFVRPAYRRRGYGRAMLEYLAREANRRGCGRFEWGVLAWNQPAINTYERFGAKIQADFRLCRLSGAPLASYGR